MGFCYTHFDTLREKTICMYKKLLCVCVCNLLTGIQAHSLCVHVSLWYETIKWLSLYLCCNRCIECVLKLNQNHLSYHCGGGVSNCVFSLLIGTKSYNGHKASEWEWERVRKGEKDRKRYFNEGTVLHFVLESSNHWK